VNALCFGTSCGVVVLEETRKHSWTIRTTGIENWDTREVAVDQRVPGRIFAGTRGDGVWLSENFGRTWSKPGYNKPGPGKVQCLTISPHDPEIVYAGTEPVGLWMTCDSGKNWSWVASVRDEPSIQGMGYPVPTVEPHVRDVVVNPVNPNIMYLALQVGYMLKTIDGGHSWQLLDNGLDEDVHTILIDPQNSDHLIVATGGDGGREGRAPGRSLYASYNEGENWNPIGMEFEEEYSVPLVMHPEDPKVMYCGIAHGNPSLWSRPSGAEARVIKTDDGGLTWKPVRIDSVDLAMDFPSCIAFDPENHDTLYVASRKGGIFSSENSGMDWLQLDVVIPTVDIWDMKILSY
jgi:photosystem II stability/assembly factor-like uncharacterized protein